MLISTLVSVSNWCSLQFRLSISVIVLIFIQKPILRGSHCWGLQKAIHVPFLMKKLKACVREDYLLTAYLALFHSHLAYELILWGNASGYNQVLRLQKRQSSHDNNFKLRSGTLEALDGVRPLHLGISATCTWIRCLLYNKRKSPQRYYQAQEQSRYIPQCWLSKTLSRSLL